jgi:hypothetical protein
VIRKKQARKIFVQPNTLLVPSSSPDNDGEDDVRLVEYPTTNAGVIQSFLDRNV